MSIKVVTAQPHKLQINDVEIEKEIESVENSINKVNISYLENTINFVFIKGIYKHNERKMTTACLFINKTKEIIKEIHGVLKLSYNNIDAKIAKTTIDFDEYFIGSLNPDEALLVHLNIPVKGLMEDCFFSISDISGSFSDIRITYWTYLR